MTRQSGISEKVLNFLKKNQNMLVSLTEIADGAGISRNNASSSVNHLRTRVGLNIESPLRGQYIYHSGKKVEIATRTGQLYEVVGQTRGYTIVRDESGELFILSPLAHLIPKDRP